MLMPSPAAIHCMWPSTPEHLSVQPGRQCQLARPSGGHGVEMQGSRRETAINMNYRFYAPGAPSATPGTIFFCRRRVPLRQSRDFDPIMPQG